jgi:hypothetical protein
MISLIVYVKCWDIQQGRIRFPGDVNEPSIVIFILESKGTMLSSMQR